MHFNRFVAIAGLIALSNLFGQDKPEPDYSNVAYVYDSASNKLVSLERENAQPAAKMKAFGGIKGTSQISGLKSPVRFPSDEKLVFVFKAPPDLDPQSLVEIVKLTPQKDHREIIRLQSHGFMGMGGVKSEADKADVPFAASKYSATSAQVSPLAALAPGEYAIHQPANPTLFCFGIDPPTSTK